MVFGIPLSVPTTRPVSLSNCLSSSTASDIITNADTSRALVRDCLHAAKHSDNPDYFAVVKSVQEYLPYLYGILNGLRNTKTIEIKSAKAMEFFWGSVFKTSSHGSGSSKSMYSSLDFERIMVLVAYGVALIKLGEEVAISSAGGGSSTNLDYLAGYSSNAATPAHKWKLASSHFATAQSVFKYLLSHPFDETPNETANSSRNSSSNNNSTEPALGNGPLDVQPSGIGSLHSVASGCAHMLILVRQRSDDMADRVQGTSSSLLSRVAVYAADRFASAGQQLKTAVNMSGSNSGSSNKFTAMFQSMPPLGDWVIEARSYCVSSCQMYLGLEQAERNKIGVAIAYLSCALDHLPSASGRKFSRKDNKTLDTSSTPTSANTKMKEALLILSRQISSDMLKLKRENDTYVYQAIPSKQEVEKNWPSGREVITTALEWKPPLDYGSMSSTTSSDTNRSERQYF